MASESLRSRLLAGYEVDDNGCWNWKGATASGYGVIVLNRKVAAERENIQDAIDRGRMASKLTEKDIEFIRSSTLSQRRLGKLLGVSPTVIWHVRNGSKWRHV